MSGFEVPEPIRGLRPRHPPARRRVRQERGLGFAVAYLHNGQVHDYVPDFIVRLKTEPARHLIVETKGFDPLEEVKVAAARRWVAAVNADGTYGMWAYTIAKRVTDLGGALTHAAGGPR